VNYVHPYHAKMEEALARGGDLYSFNDILDAIAEGKMQSFAESDTWIVTQIQDYPKRRVLDVLYIAGNLNNVLDAYRRIIDFACEHNCTLVRAHGRPGWSRFVEEYGWTAPAVVYHKEID